MTEEYRLAGSFRDPNGFIFSSQGIVYRQINREYQAAYEQLMNSGLYQKLVDEKRLISHEEVGLEQAMTEVAYQVIKPQQLSFISYPYEWCFSQLKSAALLTLEIQQAAIDYGMSLKDASAYNIQFKAGQPLFIDTLSFEPYQEGQPWVAYRQFCQHFLAPLALIVYTDIRLQQLLRVYIDGLPLDLVTKLLPVKSWANFSLLSHIHLHAKFQKRYTDKAVSNQQRQMSKIGLLGLLDNLKSAIQKFTWQPTGTEWHNYYEISNYSDQALEHKKQIITNMLEQITPPPKTVWDLGANLGLFSRIASDQGLPTIAFDIDPAAVEKNYLTSVAQSEKNILPLVLDLTNPSPGLGWANKERDSIFQRRSADVVFALALIHHLVISNNVPFSMVAEFFSRLTSALIIEFVPKHDSQVQKLLLNRVDIFSDYHWQGFETAFKAHFKILTKTPIPNTDRILYLMEKR